MRTPVASMLSFLVFATACSGDLEQTTADDQLGVDNGVPPTGSTGPMPNTSPGQEGSGTPLSPNTPLTPTPNDVNPANTPGLNPTPNPLTPAPSSTDPGPDNPPPVGTEPAPVDGPEPVTPEPSSPSPEPSPTPVENCTDVPPDDRETCATWAEWGECDAEWLAGFCEASCGRCMSTDDGNDDGNDDGTDDGSDDGTDNGNNDDVMYPPIQGGEQGHATRYWDCCKPHCSWPGNTEPYGLSALVSCSSNDQALSNYEERNSCEGGGAFMCYSMAPWAVNSQVAYGYAAVAATGDICGKCYQLQFTGQGHYGADPGSAAISGKTMVVQATNIGSVNHGQFDILIPGGGVGDFDGCSNQWGTSDLGSRYGGFLDSCKQQLGYEAPLDQYKQCVRDHCQRVFNSSETQELMTACEWFVDWFQAADNPQLVYQEIQCPEEIMNHSGLRR